MKIFKARQMYLLFIVVLSVFSITGCGGGGDGKDTVLGSGGAVIAPRVTLVSPLNNATGETLNKNITATFSKEMTPATVTAAGTFTVAKTSDGLPIEGTVTYVAAGSTATFNPTSNLAADTPYTATISVAAKDLAGAPLAAPYTWTFRTGLTLDVTAPFLVSTGVADGETGVPINRNSTATFNEVMDTATLASPATNFTVVKSILGVPVVGGAVAGTVTYVGNTATFNPTSDLEKNTEYTSTILPGAKDLAGNALVAGARPNPWSWTTAAGAEAADIIAPTVTLTSPVDLATNVDLNKTVSATFSEEMNNTTITTTTFTLAPTATPAALVSGVVLYDPLTNIATFNPDANLTASTNYTATITSGAQDAAGNALVVPAVGGLPKPNPWTFTTGTGLAPGAVDLGSASTFAIAATLGMTTNGDPANPIINGDVVLHATSTCDAVAVGADGTIGPCDGTPPTVTGTVYSGNYLPAVAIAAKGDLRQAYLDITPANLPGATPIAAGTTLGAPIGNPLVEGDNLFYPGVYQSITSILITGDLTLDAQGDANAIFVFQSSSSVGTDVGAHIILTGGAKASNVWWQAGSAATLQTSTTWNGNILAYDNVTVNTGTISCGRLFAGASTDGLLSILDDTVISVPGNDPARPLCQ